MTRTVFAGAVALSGAMCAGCADRSPSSGPADRVSINGARLFGRTEDTGSLEAGKYADPVMIDRDLPAAKATGRADTVADTRARITPFRGREVCR